MQLPRFQAILRAYLLSITVWFGLALLMGLQYKPLDPHNLWSSFLDLLVQVIAHALAFTFWTPPIFYLVGKFLSFSKNRVRYVLLWMLGAVPFVFLHTAIFCLIIPPYDDTLHRYVARSFHTWLEMVRTGFADETFVYIAIVVAAHAYEYLKRIRKEEAEKYEYQQALAASELQALKMQLHPHFLFNTLHGIATLIDGDAAKAKLMILKLSNLLRTALERGSSDLIALEDELRFAGEYLDLENMRFGSRLTIEWHIAPETRRLLVPQMILQPLVENAIRHGIACSRDPGWIEVAASATFGTLNISVRNTAGAATSNGTGVGLRNVEARLKYLYSGDASLRLVIAEDRTATASLVLPALNSKPAGAQEDQERSVLKGKNPLCVCSSSTTNR